MMMMKALTPFLRSLVVLFSLLLSASLVEISHATPGSPARNDCRERVHHHGSDSDENVGFPLREINLAANGLPILPQCLEYPPQHHPETGLLQSSEGYPQRHIFPIYSDSILYEDGANLNRVQQQHPSPNRETDISPSQVIPVTQSLLETLKWYLYQMGMSRINVKGANTQIIDLEMKKLVVKTIKDIFAQMWIIPKVQMDQEWIDIKAGLSGLDPRKVKKRYNKLYDAKRAIVVKQLGKMLESPACQISRIIRDKEVLSSVQEMRAGLINEEIGEKNIKCVQQERERHLVQHTAGHSERGKGKAAIEDEPGSNEFSYMADRPDAGHCQPSYYPQEQQQQGHTHSDSLATTFDYQLSLDHDHLVPPPHFDHGSNQWHDQHEGGFTSLPPWY